MSAAEKRWKRLVPRKRDAWVHVTVMGNPQPKFTDRKWGETCPAHYAIDCCGRLIMPRYTEDAASDYLVLQRVLQTWDASRLCDFSAHLQRRLVLRSANDKPMVAYAVWYQPGDYSAAAFEALESAT